ncbi:hypothetical protein GCM10023322_37270 [Rugosimonospora acidiphila]|uniref:DUF624 domain-containing protein n=1 Tax=Rugosimonospora acidiphila TaxID=556531 RepID=A0ABP9RWN0_9ACTN
MAAPGTTVRRPGRGAGSREHSNEAAPRPDWRETLAGAADLALLGLVLLIAALPVVTLGAAVSTGSYAVDHWCAHRSLPPAAAMARAFGRGLVPGLGALAAALAGGAVLWLDLSAVARGTVPGGPAALAGTALVAVAAAGLAGLTVVRVGQAGGAGWVGAVGSAWRTALRAPGVPLGVAGVLALTGLVGWLMPVAVPVLGGVGLLGIHVVARRAGWRAEQ